MQFYYGIHVRSSKPILTIGDYYHQALDKSPQGSSDDLATCLEKHSERLESVLSSSIELARWGLGIGDNGLQ